MTGRFKVHNEVHHLYTTEYRRVYTLTATILYVRFPIIISIVSDSVSQPLSKKSQEQWQVSDRTRITVGQIMDSNPGPVDNINWTMHISDLDYLFRLFLVNYMKN